MFLLLLVPGLALYLHTAKVHNVIISWVCVQNCVRRGGERKYIASLEVPMCPSSAKATQIYVVYIYIYAGLQNMKRKVFLTTMLC